MLPHWQTKLENSFQHILQTRMQGLPILNNALEVQVLGLQAWENNLMGIVITPWFMNLVLIPLEPADWMQLPLGSGREIAFPARNYRFMVNEIDGIGACLTHSLHSPMFKFATQTEAVNAAEQTLQELSAATTELAVSHEEAELTRYLQKQGMFDGVKATSAAEAMPVATETAPTALSRRELLFGRTRPIS